MSSALEMARKVTIVEVGPRDGLQGEPEILATATKVELIERLLDSGLRRIEVASFVNPKRVPQMADAEALIAQLPRPPGIHYIGLVLNQRGFERAREARVHEIGFVIVASETFNRRNQGASVAESLAAWSAIAAAAREAGLRTSVMISAAFGCPFEGEVPEQRVLDIVAEAAAAGPDEIALADTIGVAVPSQVTSLLGQLRGLVPSVPLRCHFHNTRNTGLANAYAAIESGVDALDASVGGAGGCPFAPAATGNIPTEDLVYMLERSGLGTGVRLETLIETSQWLQAALGRPLPGMLPRAGVFPPQSADTTP